MTRVRTFLIASILGFGLVAAGCESDEGVVPTVDCSKVTAPAYSDLTILPMCTNCHGSTVTGSARGGAPSDVNYDTYEAAKEHATAGAAQINSGKMPYPNGNGPTEEQKQQFYAWALCGTPQ